MRRTYKLIETIASAKWLFGLLLTVKVFAFESEGDLMKDLMIVDEVNQRLQDRLPVYYNFLLQGGYFNMPSARMAEEGEFGLGYAYVPPYHHYNLKMQLIDRLEVTGNYRVFRGVEDPVLSQYGYGDFTDKGANLKWAIFLPEDSGYVLPGIAIGLEDFIGTRAFDARYIVFTQVFKERNFEISVGYGARRIRGWFGGASWFPFRAKIPWLDTLALVAEYDAIPHKSKEREPHPKGRVKKSNWNVGVKWRFLDLLDFSLSYIRGDKLAFSVSTEYNIGKTTGFFPKFDDPLPCRNYGVAIENEMITKEFVEALDAQGFQLLQGWLSPNFTIRLRLINCIYPQEHVMKEHLIHLLGCYIPESVQRVIVTMEGNCCPIQEYDFQMGWIRSYMDGVMGKPELSVLAPIQEATFPNIYEERQVFSQSRDLWDIQLLPRTQTFFGGATGKFKYSLGVETGLEGYLPGNVYYSVLVGCTFVTKLSSLRDMDRLNPSQLINVRTDIVNYYKHKGLSLDQAYLEKDWALGKGWYTRLALGYFEQSYGGIAGEFLYYPVGSRFAIGCEGAIVKKRTYTGLGFTNKIRKLKGFIPTYQKFLGSQYFLNLYYDWTEAKLDFCVKIGKFLANDYGARFEVSRYFPSGLRVTIWCTPTNGHDKINGHTYYDKGIAFSMPLDIFYTRSCRDRWDYALSAWLRDVGVISAHGRSLFNMIDDERKSYP